MKLTILERVTVLDILPQKGNLITMRVLQELKQKVGFSAADIEKYDIHLEGELFHWDNEEGPEEINIGDTEKKLVIDALKALDKADSVEMRHMTLFDKFEVES